ncbi:MAG: hypothetical protein ACRYGF_03670 [Janthinobacterium lividum]
MGGWKLTPANTEAGIQNLRRGIKKMANTMTTAAKVRRDFRLGRPAKAAEPQPLHRAVVWDKAEKALASFRQRMTAAGLNPAHAEACIVYVTMEARLKAEYIPIEGDNRSAEEIRAAAYEILGRDDVLALGMVFHQFDEEAKKNAYFPFQFMGLSNDGVLVMRHATTEIEKLGGWLGIARKN